MTVKRRAQSSGKRWVRYLFIIFVTVMPRDTMILGLCYAKVTEKHKARAGESPEKLVATQTRHASSWKKRQNDCEHSSCGKHLHNAMGIVLLLFFFYFIFNLG